MALLYAYISREKCGFILVCVLSLEDINLIQGLLQCVTATCFVFLEIFINDDSDIEPTLATQQSQNNRSLHWFLCSHLTYLTRKHN